MTFSRKFILPLVLLLCWPAGRAWACYAVVVGRKASVDGSVLVAIVNESRAAASEGLEGGELEGVEGEETTEGEEARASED